MAPQHPATPSAAAYLADLAHAVQAVDHRQIDRIAEALREAWAAERTIFVAGNGGSAAAASHFAIDLGKTTLGDGPVPHRVRAIALTDNTALLTAWANDVAYEAVFAEQLRNLGRPGDVLVLISCSGASPNLLAAAQAARELGVRVIALTGPGAPLAKLAALHLEMPGPNMQIIEDLHLAVCHALTLSLRSAIAAA
ncbi:MAG: SIS domain-containing protein [Actinobacteria bacterium]|nr:SIS domain-containing protein [Actinomycetota bacterium]